jgi:hypothetical protein
MDEHRPSRMRRRGLVAAVLSAAAVAVALPISGALASGEAASGVAAGGDPAPTQARDHGDCPDKDGRGGSDSDTSVEL